MFPRSPENFSPVQSLLRNEERPLMIETLHDSIYTCISVLCYHVYIQINKNTYVYIYLYVQMHQTTIVTWALACKVMRKLYHQQDDGSARSRAAALLFNPRVLLWLSVWAPVLDPNTYQLHIKQGPIEQTPPESRGPMTKAHKKNS